MVDQRSFAWAAMGLLLAAVLSCGQSSVLSGSGGGGGSGNGSGGGSAGAGASAGGAGNAGASGGTSTSTSCECDPDNPSMCTQGCTYWTCMNVPASAGNKVHCDAHQPDGSGFSPGSYNCPEITVDNAACPGTDAPGSGPWHCTATASMLGCDRGGGEGAAGTGGDGTGSGGRGGSAGDGTGMAPPEPPPCVLGYPMMTSDPRTSVVFNESDVLRAFSPHVARANDTLKVFYGDEHALTLGVRQVQVKTAAGTMTTDYPVTMPNGSPAMAQRPMVGTTMLDGDQAGTDTSACDGAPDRCDRPMFPAIFITDITSAPMSRMGDWQYGGTPIPPHAVFGTWKAAVRLVDKTRNPQQVTVTPDIDPPRNHLDVGTGDPPPAGLRDEGFSAEARWNVAELGLQAGHTYRIQMMVHDGDQTRSGGDAGQNCALVRVY